MHSVSAVDNPSRGLPNSTAMATRGGYFDGAACHGESAAPQYWNSSHGAAVASKKLPNHYARPTTLQAAAFERRGGLINGCADPSENTSLRLNETAYLSRGRLSWESQRDWGHSSSVGAPPSTGESVHPEIEELRKARSIHQLQAHGYQSSLGTFDHPLRHAIPAAASGAVAAEAQSRRHTRRSVNPEEVIPVQDSSTTAVPSLIYHVHPWGSTWAESGLPGGFKAPLGVDQPLPGDFGGTMPSTMASPGHENTSKTRRFSRERRRKSRQASEDSVAKGRMATSSNHAVFSERVNSQATKVVDHMPRQERLLVERLGYYSSGRRVSPDRLSGDRVSKQGRSPSPQFAVAHLHRAMVAPDRLDKKRTEQHWRESLRSQSGLHNRSPNFYASTTFVRQQGRKMSPKAPLNRES